MEAENPDFLSGFFVCCILKKFLPNCAIRLLLINCMCGIMIKRKLFKIKKMHMMKKTKKTIITSVCALGVLFFPAITLAQGWVLYNEYGLPEGSISDIIYNFLFWLLAIFSVIGVIGFVIAGILYLVSAGDDDMISRAKAAMRWSIVGIIVGLSGFVIMRAVVAMLDSTPNF